MPRQAVCPKCGSAETCRIVYGLPSPEGRERQKRGEVHFGGCCFMGNDPEWHCNACGYDWRRGRNTPPVS